MKPFLSFFFYPQISAWLKARVACFKKNEMGLVLCERDCEGAMEGPTFGVVVYSVR